MKKMKNSLWAFLCFAALTACSDESTVPPPEQAPKLIGEIRIETPEGRTELRNFFYDDRQRVRQQLIVHADGSELSSEIYEYIYSPGRVNANRTFRGQTTQLSFVFDATGYCTEVWDNGKKYYTPHYNLNGYYYEEPTEGLWNSYEYHMIEDRCDLYKITSYYGPNAASSPSAARYEARFTYSTLANDANLDLFYLLTREHYSTYLDPGNPMLFGWMGKRSSNLPASIQAVNLTQSKPAEEQLTYSYIPDKDGDPVSVTEFRDGMKTKEYTIAYK